VAVTRIGQRVVSFLEYLNRVNRYVISVFHELTLNASITLNESQRSQIHIPNCRSIWVEHESGVHRHWNMESLGRP
jgi:hypothetical protein